MVKLKKERKFLIESPSFKERKFLLEFDGGEAMLEKCRQNPDIPLYLTGIIQKGDAPNRNGRIYPFSILKKECDRYMSEEVKDGQSWGELDHPAESTVPELKNTSHTIEDVWFKGTEVWGKIKLMNAFMPDNAPGKMARGFVLNGKTLGISSRALGSVYSQQGGHDIVEEDLEIICWDLVSRPSTYDANLKLAENKTPKQSNLLTESQCFGDECKIKSIKQIIRERKLDKLSWEDKVFLECMGVEKFLQIKFGTLKIDLNEDF